jgi:hypothetical protein
MTDFTKVFNTPDQFIGLAMGALGLPEPTTPIAFYTPRRPPPPPPPPPGPERSQAPRIDEDRAKKKTPKREVGRTRRRRRGRAATIADLQGNGGSDTILGG